MLGGGGNRGFVTAGLEDSRRQFLICVSVTLLEICENNFQL